MDFHLQKIASEKFFRLCKNIIERKFPFSNTDEVNLKVYNSENYEISLLMFPAQQEHF